MAYEIIWEEKGILVKFSGTVDEQEVMTINNIMYGDKRFDAITYQIADYTDVTNNLITNFSHQSNRHPRQNIFTLEFQ